MSTRNAATARRIFETLSGGDADDLSSTVEECYATNCAHHGMGSELSGPEGIKQLAKGFLTGFPDMKITVESQGEEADFVVTRVVVDATNTGEFNGFPATGKSMHIQLLSMMRFTDGKISEEWEEANLLGGMRQLGHVAE